MPTDRHLIHDKKPLEIARTRICRILAVLPLGMYLHLTLS